MNVDIWLWVNKDMWIVSVTTVKATRGQPRGIMNYLEQSKQLISLIEYSDI